MPLVRLGDFGLGTGKPMSCANVPCVPPLLQQFLHHAQGNLVAVRNLLTCAFPPVISGYNSLSKIFRQCAHNAIYTIPAGGGHSFN